jgi:hypothetical protein
LTSKYDPECKASFHAAIGLSVPLNNFPSPATTEAEEEEGKRTEGEGMEEEVKVGDGCLMSADITAGTFGGSKHSGGAASVPTAAL